MRAGEVYSSFESVFVVKFRIGYNILLSSEIHEASQSRLSKAGTMRRQANVAKPQKSAQTGRL